MPVYASIKPAQLLADIDTDAPKAPAIPLSYDELSARIDEAERRQKEKHAEAVHAFAGPLAIFCPVAAVALIVVGCGPAWEHHALLLIGAFSVNALRTKNYDTTAFVASWLACLAAFLASNALSTDTLGDVLGWIAIAGVPALLALPMWLFSDGDRFKLPIWLEYGCGFMFFFWLAGWLLFFCNSPDFYKPLGIMQSIGDALGFIISIIITLVVMAIGGAWIAAKFCNSVGIDPTTIQRAFTQKDRPTQLAHSRLITPRHSNFDDITM